MVLVVHINSFAGEANYNNVVSCASALQAECDKEKELFLLTIIVLLATQMFVVWLNTCVQWSLVHVTVAQ